MLFGESVEVDKLRSRMGLFTDCPGKMRIRHRLAIVNRKNNVYGRHATVTPSFDRFN